MPVHPIAAVNVQLAGSANVKTTSNVSVRDIYSSIFSNSSLHTTDAKLYTASLTGSGSNNDKSANKTPITPKFFTVPNAYGQSTVTLLGNALIATPTSPNFEKFYATLDNYGYAPWSDRVFMKASDNPGWIDGQGGDGFYANPRQGNLISQSPGGSPSATGAGGSTTHLDNSWKPLTDNDGTEISHFKENPAVHHISVDCAPGTADFERQIISNFELGINQPFSMYIDVGSVPVEFIIPDSTNQVASPSDSASTTSSPSGNDPTKVSTQYMTILWGGGDYYLNIYGNSDIEFFGPNGKIGATKNLHLPVKNGAHGYLTIYPLGNYLYIYKSKNITTENTVKKDYIAFDVGEAIFIPSSPITLDFNNCGAAAFNFSPVIHFDSGVLTSPLIGNGGAIDGNVFHISYLGKIGVGSRTFPITFPDTNDSNGEYKYLQDGYNIDTGFNSEGNSSYTYDLILNVPNSPTDLNTQLQSIHQQISKSISQAIGLASQSTSGAQQLNSSISNTISSGIAQLNTKLGGNNTAYINGIETALNNGAAAIEGVFSGALDQAQSAFAAGASSIESAFQGALDQAQAVLQSYINAFFGTGGTLDSISNSLTKTASVNSLKNGLPNIYSPAVYWTQLTLIRNPTSVNLNPSPQINNCDVMQVQITQSAEGSKGSVTLNNHTACDSAVAGSGRGIYTYDGNNNFCGIKPITVQLGYAGAGANSTTGLNTFFTGYVVNRRYSRSSNNESICTLDLEDVSKKLKESFAVNLPYFDGWCTWSHSKILTTDGLETISSLYEKVQNGKKFNIVTSYEDDSKTIVKNCIATYSGKKEIFKVILRNGQEISATKEHKFLKFNKDKTPQSMSFFKSEWNKLEDLKVGDKIKVNASVGRDIIIDDTEDSLIDELLGWIVGDGWYNLGETGKRNIGMIFSISDNQAFHRLFPVWKNLILNLIKDEGKEVNYNTTEEGHIRCNCSDKKLIAFFKEKGYQTATARVKKLPDYIWTASTQKQCAFLRGLFSADGYVYGGHFRKNRISLATNSKQLASDVQNLLMSLGIASNIIDKPYNNYKKAANMVNERLEGYTLDICGEASIKYMRYIGFIIDAKTNKWEPPQVSKLSRPFQEIMSIEPIGLEDVYDISMPKVHAYYANGVYSHNCNLAVFYYLCKEAGFGDDEILMSEGQSIRGLLTGDPDTFTGGCFEGHVNEQPSGGQTALPGSYLHMTLPLAVLGQEAPNYAFNFGTRIWDCCQRIREFTNFYLYANQLGHIIYCPPATALQSVNKTFVEVDTVGNFNEIKRRLDVTLDTAESRNAVFVTGVSFVRSNDQPGNPGVAGSWQPHAHSAVAPGFPNNPNATCFAPWLRYVFLRNPKWETPALAALACQEILRRATRQRVIADFSGWGDSTLLPYNVITINESINNETSVNNFNPYVIASHTITATVADYTLTSDLSVEAVDFTAANYEPNLANIRD